MTNKKSKFLKTSLVIVWIFTFLTIAVNSVYTKDTENVNSDHTHSSNCKHHTHDKNGSEPHRCGQLPESLSKAINESIELYKNNKKDEAVNRIKLFLTENPDTPYLYLANDYIARYYLKDKKYDESVEIYKNVIKRYKNGNAKKTNTNTNKKGSINSRNNIFIYKSYMEIVEIYRKQGKYGTARELIGSLVTDNSIKQNKSFLRSIMIKRISIYYFSGFSAYKKKDFKNALDYLDNALNFCDDFIKENKDKKINEQAKNYIKRCKMLKYSMELDEELGL